MSQELIDLCRQNDRKAQYQVYKMYSKAMLNAAYRILGDQEQAEDVLQEAFLKAFTHLDTFKGDSTFGAWLKRIVVNQAIGKLRKSRLKMIPLEENEDFEEDDRQGELLAEELLQVERIRKAIEQLPDGFRVVFSLYVLEGYDHGEIAEILSISESTSKSQFNRAKNKLRQLLQTSANAQAF